MRSNSKSSKVSKVSSDAKNIFIFTMVLVSLGFVYSLEANPPQLKPQISTLLVDYGNGRQAEYQGPAVPNMTALDALVAAANGGLAVNYTVNPDESINLLSIGNQAVSQQGHWYLYIDRGSSRYSVRTEDANNAILYPGDTLEAKFF